MMNLKRFLLPALLILLFVAPIIVSGEPNAIWLHELGDSITSITLDNALNYITASDSGGSITSYPFDGNGTNWVYNFTSPSYATKILSTASGGKILAMTNSLPSGNVTMLNGVTGEEQWNVTYNSTWGNIQNIDIENYGVKSLVIYDNLSMLYNSDGGNIGNISKVSDYNWKNGIISKDGNDFVVLTQEDRADLFLYKYGYNKTWTNYNHTICKLGNYTYKRIITINDIITTSPFSITTIESEENLPSVLYGYGDTSCIITDVNLTIIPSTSTYNPYTNLYNINVNLNDYTTAYIFYGCSS